MILELALAERSAARRARLGPEEAPPPLPTSPERSPVMSSRLLGLALLLVIVLAG
jgi:hypothetical protein